MDVLASKATQAAEEATQQRKALGAEIEKLNNEFAEVDREMVKTEDDLKVLVSYKDFLQEVKSSRKFKK